MKAFFQRARQYFLVEQYLFHVGEHRKRTSINQQIRNECTDNRSAIKASTYHFRAKPFGRERAPAQTPPAHTGANKKQVEDQVERIRLLIVVYCKVRPKI